MKQKRNGQYGKIHNNKTGSLKINKSLKCLIAKKSKKGRR